MHRCDGFGPLLRSVLRHLSTFPVIINRAPDVAHLESIILGMRHMTFRREQVLEKKPKLAK